MAIDDAIWHGIDVLVVGGANWDHLVLGDRLPGPGETRRASRHLAAPGGKGANQALAARLLGAAVALVGRIGDDGDGRRIRDHLADAGVDVRHLHTSPGAATGSAVVQVGGDGEKRIMAVPGANALVTAADIRAACSAYAPRVALLSFEAGQANALLAATLLAGRGCRVVLDPAPAERLDDALLARVLLVKPDAAEAAVLTGITVHDRAGARAAAHRLRARGAQAAIVQAGDDGDLLVDADGELWLPRLEVERVDATGAGDAYIATIAAGLAQGQDLRAAARAGSAAAALATRELGAQSALPDRAEIEHLLAEAT